MIDVYTRQLHGFTERTYLHYDPRQKWSDTRAVSTSRYAYRLAMRDGSYNFQHVSRAAIAQTLREWRIRGNRVRFVQRERSAA